MFRSIGILLLSLFVLACQPAGNKQAKTVRSTPPPASRPTLPVAGSPQPDAVTLPTEEPEAPALTDKLTAFASQQVGKPYKAGGTTPEGFDCSGFTGFVFDVIDVKLPRDSRSQAQVGHEIPLEEIKAGDLLFFKNKSGRIFHVAMVYSVTEERYAVVHATSRGVALDYSDSYSWRDYWKSRFAFARRVLD